MADIKKLLEARRKQRNRRPTFTRQGYGIYKRINAKWRKPKGVHSKQRHHRRGHRSIVKAGFRTNKLVRDLDISGLVPVVINSVNHVSLLNKNIHGAIVGRAVGNRKKMLLLAELKKYGIKVLNLKEGYEKFIQDEFNKRKQERDTKIAEKTKKKAKKEEKKEVPKEEKQITEEEKQAQEKKEKDKLLTKSNK